MGPFELVTDGSQLPVFAFAVKEGVGPYTAFDVSRVMRMRGWLIPAYRFPPNREDLAALRIVVKNGFTRDLADFLLDDLGRAVDYLQRLDGPLPAEPGEVFHH
jgi:glutamate decarboxylase